MIKNLLLLLFIVGGLAFGAIYAVSNIPLNSAWSAAESYLPVPASWREADFEGTLRSGRVRQLDVPRLGGVDLGKLDLAWEVRPSSLATGRLSVALDGQLEEARFQGVATRSLSGWQVTEGNGEIAAEQLKQMAQRRGAEIPPISGTVNYQVERLTINNNGELKELEGRVIGHGISTTHHGKHLDLGSFVSTVSGSDSRVQGELSDQGGPVELSGTWQATQDGSYELNATIAPRDSADPALIDWLNEHGEPSGEGFRIRRSGSTASPSP